jgi:hypothetical protein
VDWEDDKQPETIWDFRDDPGATDPGPISGSAVVSFTEDKMQLRKDYSVRDFRSIVESVEDPEDNAWTDVALAQPEHSGLRQETIEMRQSRAILLMLKAALDFAGSYERYVNPHEKVWLRVE